MKSQTMTDAMQQRYNEYTNQFQLSQSTLRKIVRAFMQELQIGLKAHLKNPDFYDPTVCSLMMLDTSINKLPTGKEKGSYYAIDFGGTNVRAILCSADGEGSVSVKSYTQNLREYIANDLPKGLMDKKATASMLFEEVAKILQKLLLEENKSSKEVGIGFTFSFAINQKNLTTAILKSWSKEFETGLATSDPVVGQNVCALLDNAFKRLKINAKVAAILNDTVGALLTGFYAKKPEDPPCTVGIILGTGVNGAYVQPDAQMYGYKGIVINTELASFDKELPQTDIDYEIDYNSIIKGRQLFEKMVSGMYIPEMFRLLVLRIFQHEAPKKAWIMNSIAGDHCAVIFNDSHPYNRTVDIMKSIWLWEVSNPTHLKYLHQIAYLIFQRSAAIAAAVIACMAMATGNLQPAMDGVTVGIDGSLYVQNIKYQKMIREYLEIILEPEIANLIKCVIAEDGSGKGAAILAAAMSSN